LILKGQDGLGILKGLGAGRCGRREGKHEGGKILVKGAKPSKEGFLARKLQKKNQTVTKGALGIDRRKVRKSKTTRVGIVLH